VGQSAFVSYTMGYSAQTKPRNLKDVLEAKLEKKRKNLLGPPAGKKMLFFIDDLNMPALEVHSWKLHTGGMGQSVGRLC
jgi:dynein heavy chain